MLKGVSFCLSVSLCTCTCSDLCTAFGKDVTKLVEVRPLINDLLTEGRRSKTNKTKTLATWATKELRKLKSQAWWGRRRSHTLTLTRLVTDETSCTTLST